MKKSISVDVELYERGMIRAREERRSFSAYVAFLIDRDVKRAAANGANGNGGAVEPAPAKQGNAA
jgi:predicted CopG family antitoxin